MNYEILIARFNHMIGDHLERRYIVVGVSIFIIVLVAVLIYYVGFSKPTPRLTPEGNHEEQVLSGTDANALQKLQTASEQLMDERRAAIQNRTETLDKKITQEVKQSTTTSLSNQPPLTQQYFQNPTAGILPPDPFELNPN